jgi:hypothetical protein
MSDMYEKVFENEVRDYIQDKEADRGMKLNISEEGIKKIAHYLIHDNEYIWETIHEIIDYQLRDYNFMSDDEEVI